MKDPFAALRSKLMDWWSGEYVPHYNDPHSPIVFIGGRQRRPWIATAAEAAFAWTSRNGWNLAFTLIGLIGLWLTYLTI